MKKQNKFDTFYESMMGDVMYGQAGSEKEFEADIEATGAAPVEDTEGPMDASANITGELNGNGRMAAECISNIFALVEDEGQEMLDKQAAEKLEDIIELASSALRELNNRLD